MFGRRSSTALAAAVVIGLCAAADAGAEPVAATAHGDLAMTLARPWLELQQADGRFHDYQSGAADGVGRYGEAMIGLGLLRTGVRSADQTAIDTGLRAMETVLLHPGRQAQSPSVFEMFAMAAGYNLVRTRLADHAGAVALLPAWRARLAAERPIELRRGLAHLWNKSIVEAAAVLELLRTGVRSDVPGTWLGDRSWARARAAWVINRAIPERAPRRDGRAMMGDGPSYPLAYHALSLGFYAHGVRLLGGAAGTEAKRLVVEAARASLAVTSPDGDIAYVGRSQEQAWALAFTAYGARTAARFTQGTMVARLLGLADLALVRLREVHPLIDGGFAIVPAFGGGATSWYPGIDQYAGAGAYGGLTIVALDLAQDVPVDGRVPSRVAVSRDVTEVLPAGAGAMAILRRDAIWMAVKRARSGTDLRYDLGLVSLKWRSADGWRDVIPHRPKADGPTLGPTLIRDGVEHEPWGGRIATSGDAIRVIGGFHGVDGRVTFSYRPTCCGATVSFSGPPGASYRYSTFFAAGATPRLVSDRTVIGAGHHVSVSAPATLALGGGYDSAMDRGMTRADLTFTAGASGRVEVRVEANR